jgi:hypothetical protein
MANSTSGVRHIAISPWDQVNVTVKDSLTGGPTGVHSDVEAAYGSIRSFDLSLSLLKQQIARVQLRSTELEI